MDDLGGTVLSAGPGGRIGRLPKILYHLQLRASLADQQNRLTVRQRRGSGPLDSQFCLFSSILLARGGDSSEAACSHEATSEEEGGVELPGSGSSLPIRPRILMQASAFESMSVHIDAGALPLESAGDMPKFDGFYGKRGRVE